MRVRVQGWLGAERAPRGESTAGMAMGQCMGGVGGTYRRQRRNSSATNNNRHTQRQQPQQAALHAAAVGCAGRRGWPATGSGLGVSRVSGIQAHARGRPQLAHDSRSSGRHAQGCSGGAVGGRQGGCSGIQGYRCSSTITTTAPAGADGGRSRGRQGVCVQGFRHTGAAAAAPPPPPHQLAHDGRRSGRHAQACSGIQAYRCCCNTTTTPAGARR
jgi:hypothetical protein